MAEVPKSERLVNLVIALLEARRPMTLAELKQRTGYYSTGTDDAARRMFERDKDELRTLGVPIETRPTDAFGGVDGYIIDRRSYEQPDVELTPEEAAALALVVQMSAEPGTRLAVTRLAARSGTDVAATGPAGATLSLGDAPWDALAQAVVERRRVTFDYRRGDGTRAERHVDPYAVLSRRGAWYLVGHDADRDDVRAFRLDRLQSTPSVADAAGTFDIPPGFDPHQHVTGPAVPTHDARIAVQPAAGFQAQAYGGELLPDRHGDLDVYAFGTADLHRLATWVVGLADRAVVLAPTELRDEVVARLRNVREALA